MDEADLSDARIQSTIDDGIAECRRKPSLIPTGSCYYCSSPIPAHHLFCPSDCSDDYEFLTDRRKANA